MYYEFKIKGGNMDKFFNVLFKFYWIYLSLYWLYVFISFLITKEADRLTIGVSFFITFVCFLIQALKSFKKD